VIFSSHRRIHITGATAFFDWASHYEDGTREGRNPARHEPWLATLPCPVLRLDGSRPVAELVGEVLKMLQA